LSKRPKTDQIDRPQGPPRVLIVDDHPDAARLLGKIYRRAGYEVAEVDDHHVALNSIVDEPEPIHAVVAGFSTAGTGASLRLLDAIRNHHDQRVNTTRFLLISDHPRKQIFCFQAGADAIMLRPLESAELLDLTADMIVRPEEERIPYRRRKIQALKAERDISPSDPALDGRHLTHL
jgi:DNA-binding response OmpR family regulator